MEKNLLDENEALRRQIAELQAKIDEKKTWWIRNCSWRFIRVPYYCANRSHGSKDKRRVKVHTRILQKGSRERRNSQANPRVLPRKNSIPEERSTKRIHHRTSIIQNNRPQVTFTKTQTLQEILRHFFERFDPATTNQRRNQQVKYSSAYPWTKRRGLSRINSFIFQLTFSWSLFSFSVYFSVKLSFLFEILNLILLVHLV